MTSTYSIYQGHGGLQYKKMLDNLNPNKSPGPDGIHPRVLRELSTELAIPLRDIFQLTLETGQLPTEWKLGHVSPIFKKGSKLKPGNYRPVSLTSVACKVMEKIVRDRITNHLNRNQLLTDCQHGFIKGRSCVTQLLAMLDKWTEILDQGGNIDAIYLDFSKCFDSVPHERLLLKLKKYGIQGKLWDWISDFLRGRKQQVSVNSYLSTLLSVLSGIPQGSVIGPILFIIFVNEMPDIVHSHILMFADDTKIFKDIRNATDSSCLQDDINALQEWANQWQLRFNTDKCKRLHIGRSNAKHQYHMNPMPDLQTPLGETELEKDLGVWIDNNLAFTQHCEKQITKANRILGMIRRSYSFLEEDSVKRLYTSLVRPILEYGYPAWSPQYRKDCELLENVQRRATKLAPALKDLSYEDRLRSLDLPSLYYRRARGDVIQIYKHVKELYNIQAQYIKIDLHETRGHKFRLRKDRVAKKVRQNFLTERAANTWNRLPPEVVEAPSLNSFKARIDKLWKKYRYNQRSIHEQYSYLSTHTERPNLVTGY